MASNPQVLGLLEEMLGSGKTPEEVCRHCPELLPEVLQRWQEFQLIDAQPRTLLRGIATGSLVGATAPAAGGLPQVPGYEVEAVLGRGGMGVVYKARHLALKRTVALKMLAAGHPHPVERARFRAEAEAVARLQHPNIVQIHEVGEAAGRPFFALEYVAGGSLAERLAGQPLPPRDAAALVGALAEAMHLAHSRNLVHRDLKPANVLLAGEVSAPVGQCQPKVTDFGLVRQLDADSGQTVDGLVMGTPSYMAPEQAEGRAHAAGPAADVYALGAILYECLTGRPPFQGATAQEMLEQVRSREPAAPSSLNRQVPRDLETICLKCLRKPPEQRYASAQELADDLRRFVRGEPVAARPVGRPERIALWVRRNPTVAGLSAVAALALVAGTVVSLLFGIEARRKADQLEQQTIQLQEQTLAAQENARRAEENEKEMTRVLVAGLLIPIGRNPHLLTDPLDAAEMDAVRQLRATPAPVRLQLLETALHDPETARRVGRRADQVVQAIVGCDRTLRADVARLVVQRIQEPGAPQDVTFACARLGLALHLVDRAWAEHAADALLVALREPLIERTDVRLAQDDYPPLAEALVAVCEYLPPTHAADCAARALAVFLTRLRGPEGRSFSAHQQLLQAVVVLGPGLDAATAARAAEALEATLREPDSLQMRWPSLCMALAAVCRRLPASKAASYVNRTVDFILETQGATKEKDMANHALQAQALGALSGVLDAAQASRAAGAIITILGEVRSSGEVKVEFISLGYIASALARVVERLDAAGATEATRNLVLVLRKAANIEKAREELRAALVVVCKRLDAAGAARAAETLAAATRDPKTSVLVRTLFADALAVLASRLTPDQAVPLESALVDALLADLADAKSRDFRGLLGQALAKACERPGATGAARAAEGLVAVINDPQNTLIALEPLAAALVLVSGQLPSKEALAHANQAVDTLDSLWVARPGPLDRASVAAALAALWTRLDPTDAAARARRVAGGLEDALRDASDAPDELYRLAEALTAVYQHFGPAERSERANAAADALVTALRKPRDDSWKIVHLSEALAGLFAHLDRSSGVRVADAVFTVLSGPNVQQFRVENHQKLFKEIAARLDDRDLQRLLDHVLAVGRVQRVLLDSLARSKKRSFRNTWDYLDGTASNGKGTAGLSLGTNR
jgi:tRNA A-37 threonylcarbamoyl transferase component Bud32